MMEPMLGLINLMEEPGGLDELTRNRCLGAVPFAGRYRLIDFALSNLCDSGIRQVAVLSHPKAGSLLAHIGDGGSWGLDAAEEAGGSGGLTVLPHTSAPPGAGGLELLASHADYLRGRSETYALLAPSGVLYRMDFRTMLEHHEQSGADITVLYKRLTPKERESFVNGAFHLELDATGRVAAAQWRTLSLPGEHDVLYLGTMLMKRTLLLELLGTSRGTGAAQVHDSVWSRLDELDVRGCASHGYFAIIDSLDSYYAHSMGLLHPQGWRELLHNRERLHTRPGDEQPTACPDSALVRNSFIAPSCRIEGVVENSIIFPGVSMEKGAVVRNSIVMNDCEIAASATLDRVILDKLVQVESGSVLTGEMRQPYVAAKYQVV
ncbi:glucose-1-phosphate adenylyltransferase subunit GlgD [Paenibacillus athensensis]|uniref:Glucose-1-phosphate adenylyltransferase subunit GlgD n=1 Tax=Paenibacillus athensensis TaxID=1967502 RepID=A0A4Y8PYG8_9BACL|nr:glucose-1-phosphate adenylyltransferase subunit GlgD [Paenibacillus athensensis]MCD1261211.1 glucose-1-phosphate adenylyltransferase subunit GlgD [Paenibacillus athensensis]